MSHLHNILPQPMYARYLAETADFNRDFVKKNLSAQEQELLRKFKTTEGDEKQAREREVLARQLIKAQADAYYNADGSPKAGALRKAGVTSGLGYNFYDLRAPVQLSYPVNVPFRNMLPRVGRVNDGYGVAAHWMATRNFGTVYAGVSEGQRNQLATPDQNNYTATYKEIGVERGVTFTAQFAGEGFSDNVADEHLRGLHELWLQEEALMLMGNSGTASGNNGYLLGTTNTPVNALVTATSPIGSGVNVTVYCIAMTGLANPNNTQYGYGLFPTATSGLTPTYTRTNQDGSTTVVNGGMGIISAASNTVVTTGGAQVVTSTVTATKGAFSYAWYVSINASPITANAYLYSITTVPTVTINSNPVNTNQAANAAGLTTDHSNNPTDFDGLLTYAAATAGTYWKDLGGATLTSGKDGTVVEIEAALQDRWTQYQAEVDEIWCGTQARITLDQAIRYSGTASPAFRFEYSRDAQNNLLGGYVVSAYQSKWSLNSRGGAAIPVRHHPMLPPGCIFFHVKTNPYPHSRIPFVAGMLVQREYYSIEWPLVTRQWTFGTYVHEVLAHNLPWISGFLSSVGPFVGN